MTRSASIPFKSARLSREFKAEIKRMAREKVSFQIALDMGITRAFKISTRALASGHVLQISMIRG